MKKTREEHFAKEAKREAVAVVTDRGVCRFFLGDVRFILGDVLVLGDPEEPFSSPEIDDPATVGTLGDALTDGVRGDHCRTHHEQGARGGAGR